MVKINTLKEAEDFLNKDTIIWFQNEMFHSKKEFKHFIDSIKNGTTFKMPTDCDEYAFYCNFGTICCDTLVITKYRLLFFNLGKLFINLRRQKTDDIEMSYTTNGCTYSSNPLVYDSEQDIQFENF